MNILQVINKAWSEALPIGTNVPPARIMSLMLAVVACHIYVLLSEIIYSKSREEAWVL